MKQFIFFLLFSAFAITASAQDTSATKHNVIWYHASSIPVQNDTLFIPVGKYKFIKIGDKVYKIMTSLDEVKDTDETKAIGRWPFYAQPLQFLNGK